MASHYDVLGVSQHAAPEDVRRAYLELARELHPDRTLGSSAVDAERASRRMQEVNEAWRVLRDPSSRAAYDRALSGGRRPHRPPSHAASAAPRRAPVQEEDDDLDRPIGAPDVVVSGSVMRALPWLAVAVILLVIFVFTAFAGDAGTPDSPQQLVGKCISSGGSSVAIEVPCQGPNDGEVVLVVERTAHCPDGSTSLPIEDGQYLCVQPHNDIPAFTTTTTSVVQ